jgi:multiple sugar transport system substrate-binding protein
VNTTDILEITGRTWYPISIDGQARTATSGAIKATRQEAVTALSRRHLVLAVTAATPLLLQACTSPGGGAGPGGTSDDQPAPKAQLKPDATITWALDGGGSRVQLRQDQVKLFTRQFPEMRVQLISGATEMEQLVALFAAGTPPDLFRQGTAGLVHFAPRREIVALDPYIKRDRFDLSDFFPVAWEQWKWKGTHFGAPFLSLRLLYYNRALSRQLAVKGFPASWQDSSWTWEMFLEACQKATIRQGTATTRWGANLGQGTRDWSPWIWNNGGDLFNADGTKSLLTEPPAVEALQFMVDLIHKHQVSPAPNELQALGGEQNLFNAGSLLTFHGGQGVISANRRGAGFDWSITALPRGKSKQAYAAGGGAGWYLAAPSQVRDETWELIKVLVSPDSVRLEALRGESMPSRRSVANEPAYISPTELPGADMKVVVEALEHLHIEAPLARTDEINAAIAEEFVPMWRGEKRAQDATSAAVRRITPLLNRAGE